MPKVRDGTVNASNDVRCSGVGAVMLPVGVDSWVLTLRTLLLHAAGVDVQEIYFTLASEEESSSFTKTVKVLDDKSCPVRVQACRKCGKIGHFQIKCT